VLGGIVLIIAIGSLTLALVQGPGWGWASARTLISFATSVAALVAFIVSSMRHHSPVIDLRFFRNPTFAWANVAMVLLSVAFAIELLGVVLWLQEGWRWSALRTGVSIVPGPAVVSVTAIGLRRYTKNLPVGLVAAIGTVLIGLGGVLIAMTLTAKPDYAAEILPGWMIIGAGVGFALPTIVGAGTSTVAAHQTSTASAIVQMARQIGSALGVAALIIIIGPSLASTGALDHYTDALWCAGGFALAGALCALLITPRHRRAVQPATAPG
jgi:hypothetical protein